MSKSHCEWEKEIRDCEAASVDAFLAADLEALNRLWAEDYVVNSPLQRVLGKKEVLGLLQAGRIRHTSYTFEIEHIHRDGDVVVVMGKDLVDGPPGNTLLHRRFTNIWALRDGTWRTIARHAHVVNPGGSSLGGGKPG